MKTALSFLLVILTFVSCFTVSSFAADYATYDLIITDNGDGTVTVTAYAPSGAYSGKLVLTSSDRLSYVSDSASYPAGSIFNPTYYKNGVSGICIAFAFSNELTEKTQVISLKYNVVSDAEISAADIYSEEWNLTNGSEFIANHNNGPVNSSYIPKTYTVKFLDANDTLLKEEIVVAGGDATPPVAPEMEGYEFVRWDADYTNVNSDITVKADYVIKMFTVTFIAQEGVTIVGATTVTVPYGTSIDELPYPNVDVGFSGDYVEEWKVYSSEEEYDKSKGITSDITMIYTYSVIMGPRPPVTNGDVNNDGYVDNIDAAIILKYDAGIINEVDYYLEYGGDVNGDLYIDNIDAALILKYDAGLIEGF